MTTLIAGLNLALADLDSDVLGLLGGAGMLLGALLVGWMVSRKKGRDLGPRLVRARGQYLALVLFVISIYLLAVSLYNLFLKSVVPYIIVAIILLGAILVCGGWWWLLPMVRLARYRSKLKAEADEFIKRIAEEESSFDPDTELASCNKEYAATSFSLVVRAFAPSRFVDSRSDPPMRDLTSLVLWQLRDMRAGGGFAVPFLVEAFLARDDQSFRQDIEQTLRVIDPNYLQNPALRKHWLDRPVYVKGKPSLWRVAPLGLGGLMRAGLRGNDLVKAWEQEKRSLLGRGVPRTVEDLVKAGVEADNLVKAWLQDKHSSHWAGVPQTLHDFMKAALQPGAPPHDVLTAQEVARIEAHRRAKA